MDIKETHPYIDIRHWYCAAKLGVCEEMLTEAGAWPCAETREHVLLDVGAGSGLFIKALYKSLKTSSKTAYAVDPLYPTASLGDSDGVQFLRTPPEGVAPTHLFFMDVLEHVEDDRGLLAGLVKGAPPGSTFLATAPAFQSLWSQHDVFLGHRRRYTLEQLEGVMSDCGLKVVRGRYFFALLLPAVIFARKVWEPLWRWAGRPRPQGIRPAPGLLNIVLRGLLRLEISLGKLNRLCGVSCIVVAIKAPRG